MAKAAEIGSLVHESSPPRPAWLTNGVNARSIGHVHCASCTPLTTGPSWQAKFQHWANSRPPGQISATADASLHVGLAAACGNAPFIW